MSEVILPPIETEPELPEEQLPEVDKPTELSKVIAVKFNPLNTGMASTANTRQSFYTTDTDAWVVFEIENMDAPNGEYSLVLYNKSDGSIFQRTGDIISGAAYYKIEEEEIKHAGDWVGQVVITLVNGKTTTSRFSFNVAGHLLDGKDVRQIVIQDFETLMKQLEELKNSADIDINVLKSNIEEAQRLAKESEVVRQETFEVNESERIAAEDERKQAELHREETYDSKVDAAIVKADVVTKVNDKVAELSPTIQNVTAQLAHKAEQSALETEKQRINSLIALPEGSTANDARLEDIKVGADGMIYSSPGDSVRSQVTNGYNLTRNKPISDDLTTLTIDGKYYSYVANLDMAMLSQVALYTGRVNNVIPYTKYRIMVYDISLVPATNVLNFYTSQGLLISRDSTNYGIRVIDATNRIVEVTAPGNAAIMTYTNYLVDKTKGYAKLLFNKLNVEWLEVGDQNLDTSMKSKLENINNAFTLTTNAKTSNDLIYLKEDGYYLSPIRAHVLNAKQGTAYFKPKAGNKYRMHVYTIDAANITGNLAVIYFWDKNNVLIPQSTYEYTVTDSEKMIIEIIAPIGAVEGTITYSQSSGWRDAFYVYSVGGKQYYDWLEVNKDNLSEDLKAKIYGAELPGVSLKYGHSINKPFNFTGKTITFFGDSIAYGVTSPNLAVTANPFCKIFADKFSMVSDNRAVIGTTITGSESQYSILNRILSYTTQRDYLLIAGGTNDWTLGKTVGKLGDTDSETYYGALHLICEHIKMNHPNSKVIFITPINQNVTRPLSITTIDEYRNATFEMATSYGHSVVDGSKIGFPSEKGAFADLMCSDGVHPSLLGHSFYGNSLSGILV